jgi:hypothetical protein
MAEQEEESNIQEQPQQMNAAPEMDTQQAVANVAAPQQQAAPPAQTTAPPAVQNAPALAGGTQQAPATTAAAGAGLTAGTTAVAAPVTAGATGTAAPSDSGGAGAGAGSDGGGQFTMDGMTFDFNAKVGSVEFLGNTIALASTAFKAMQGEDVTAENIAIPTLANKFFSLSDAKIDSITFNKTEGFKNIKISAGTVAMGGGKLFYAEGLKAEMNKGNNYEVSLSKTIINGFGNAAPIGVAGGFLEIGKNGQILRGGAPLIEQQGFKIEGVEITQDSLSLKKAQVVLPKLGTQNLDLIFNNVTAQNGNWNLQGEVKSNSPDGSLSFLENKLKLNALSANLKLEKNVFSGTITSPFEYLSGEGAAMAKANGLGTITVGKTSAFQINDGKAEADLGGMKFVGEGLEMNLSAAAQSISVKTGTVKIPSLNKDFKVTVEGGSLSNSKGFDFKSIEVASGGALEVLPNLEASGKLTITKTADGKYGLKLDKGSFKTKKAVAGMNVDAKAVNLVYNEETGITGDTTNTTFSSSFFDIKAAGKVTFDSSTGFAMPTVTAKFKGLGPQPITATATGVVYDKTAGLKIEKITGDLPKIGDTTVNAEATNIVVGDSFSVGTANVNFGLDKKISLAAGKIKINLTDTNVSVNETGQWAFNVGGDLDVSAIPDTVATGKVKVGYDQATGPTIQIEGGEIKSKIAGFDVIAKDINYNNNPAEKEKILAIKSVNVKGLETDSMKFNAQANGIGYGQNGLSGAIILTGAGDVEIMKGANLTGITGKLIKDSKTTKVEIGATGKIQNKYFNGDVKNVKVGYALDGTKTIAYDSVNIESNYFKVSSTKGAYNSESGFSLAGVKVDAKGLDKIGSGATTKAENVTYNKEGLKVGTFHAGIGWEGKKDVIAVDGKDINLPAEGAMSGDVKVTVPTNFSLGGGAIQVEGVTSEVKLEEAGWNFKLGGKVKVGATGAAGSTASGDVEVSYNSQTGFKAGINNGAFNAKFANLGLTIDAQGINYDSTKGELKVASGNVTVSKDKLKTEQDLTGSITGLTVKGTNIDFKNLTVAAGGIKMSPFQGVEVSVTSAILNKTGNDFKATVKGGFNINKTSPVMVKGSTTGSLTYDITKSQLSGEVDKLELETSIFKTTVNDAKIDSTGIKIAKATLGLSKSLDPAVMKTYIPGFQPWMLDFVKGVEFVAENISYTADKGLQIGKFYPNIPPIEFEMMGFKGVLDLKNQKGSITGNKDISVEQKMPTLHVPIMAGLEATAGISIYGSLGMSANLSLEKMGDYWNIGGGVGMKANAGIKAELGIGINVVAASATAKIGLDIGIKSAGNASLQGGLRYNPTTKTVEAATPLKFNYNLNAKLIAAVYAKLEYEILWGLAGGSKTIDLASWELGSLDLSGESQAADFSGLWANLKNKAKLMGPRNTLLYEKK